MQQRDLSLLRSSCQISENTQTSSSSDSSSAQLVSSSICQCLPDRPEHRQASVRSVWRLQWPPLAGDCAVAKRQVRQVQLIRVFADAATESPASSIIHASIRSVAIPSSTRSKPSIHGIFSAVFCVFLLFLSAVGFVALLPLPPDWSSRAQHHSTTAQHRSAAPQPVLHACAWLFFWVACAGCNSVKKMPCHSKSGYTLVTPCMAAAAQHATSWCAQSTLQLFAETRLASVQSV